MFVLVWEVVIYVGEEVCFGEVEELVGVYEVGLVFDEVYF